MPKARKFMGNVCDIHGECKKVHGKWMRCHAEGMSYGKLYVRDCGEMCSDIGR
jgi:hypothetical protein